MHANIFTVQILMIFITVTTKLLWLFSINVHVSHIISGSQMRLNIDIYSVTLYLTNINISDYSGLYGTD